MLDVGWLQETCSRGRLLSVADLLVAVVCVPLLTAVGWWSAWTAVELQLPSGQAPARAGCYSAAVGTVAVYCHSLWYHSLQRWLWQRREWWRRCLARLLLLLLFLGHVLLWRGMFLLSRLVTADSWHHQLTAVQICAAVLLTVRSFRAVLRPPLHVVVDWRLLHLNTILNTTPKHRFQVRSVDGLSTVVVCALVSCLWCNVWRLMDRLLEQRSLVQSAASSMALGYLICVACYFCSLLTNVTHGQQNSASLAIFVVHSAFLTAAFIGVLNVWRGIFLLADVLFYSQLGKFGAYAALVALGGALICAIALSVCRLSKNLLLPGATRDDSRDLSLTTRCVSRLLQEEDDLTDRDENQSASRDETLI